MLSPVTTESTEPVATYPTDSMGDDEEAPVFHSGSAVDWSRGRGDWLRDRPQRMCDVGDIDIHIPDLDLPDLTNEEIEDTLRGMGSCPASGGHPVPHDLPAGAGELDYGAGAD